MNPADHTPTDFSGAGLTLLLVVLSYALGCISTAHLLVRWRTGRDIRTMGSGNAGATNVGRVLGRQGFLIVFLADLAKGLIAVGVGLRLGLGPWPLGMIALAVTAGHIWPLQLRFRGGRGIATSLGALWIYEIRAIVIMVAVFLAVFALTRRFTFSGLVAYAICPAALLTIHAATHSVLVAGLISLLIWSAHRGHLVSEWQRCWGRRPVPEAGDRSRSSSPTTKSARDSLNP